MAEPEQTVEAPVETPPEPQVIKEVVKEYVYDTSAIDASIETLKSAIENVDESQVAAIETQIQALERQKTETATKADLAELERLRRENFNAKLEKELPKGKTVDTFFPNLADDVRMAIAQELKATETAEPDDAIKELAKKEADKRWGGNLTPDGAGVLAEEEQKELTEAMKNGDLDSLVNSPTMKDRIRVWMGMATE